MREFANDCMLYRIYAISCPSEVFQVALGSPRGNQHAGADPLSFIDPLKSHYPQQVSFALDRAVSCHRRSGSISGDISRTCDLSLIASENALNLK
jgi:hypothetical protein